VKTHPLYINGEFVAALSSTTVDVIDPSTTEVIARVPDAGAADVGRAVAAAREAFDAGVWKDATAQDRGRVLFEIARIVRERAGELAELETRNTGKPIVEAEFDIADAATCFEYYGGLATKIHGDVIPVPDNAMSLALREPIGVAGQIIPWNYPMLMAAWKLAPAICAGCTAVLKPAEQTPLSVLALASSFADAGGGQHRDGRRRHRRRHRRARGRRQDRVHRQRRGRQDDHASRCRDTQEDLARARRQVAQHLFCRR
jgi:betaine-aldehyde dehydrogenase